MTRDQIYSELTVIFRDVFDNDQIKPNDQMTAKDVPQWDSLNHINLIIATEKHFKFKFETSEVINLANVGDLVNVIARKIS